MQSVGQKLRHVREAQGRTLEQVNSTTRISLKNLRAIEADEIAVIGSAFLYRSFVRQFAQDLKLDYADLETAIQESAGRIPAPRMPGEGVSAVPRVPALPIGRRKKTRLLYSISSFAVMLVACSGIYALWQNSKFNLPAFQKLAKTRLTTPPVPAVTQASHPAAPPEKSDSNANTAKPATRERC